MDKVLLLYITSLSGHYKAAKAIEEALKKRLDESQIVSLDALHYLHPFASKVINFVYSLVITKLPFIWGGLYDKSRFIKGLGPLKWLVYSYEARKMEKLILKIKPRVVVCTQAFPCGVFAFLKSKNNKYKDISLIGVITDFWPNSFWLARGVDYYVIGLDWAKEKFKEIEMGQDRIKVFGLPIRCQFVESFERGKIAQEFNLIENLPAILLMGGGSGLGPLGKVASVLDNSNLDFQLIVVCGRNKKLYKWFLTRRFKKPIKVFSYTEAIPQLMDFSDIIITKAGGITIAESLAKGLAIIVFKPIPGQEYNNLKFLLKEKLVFKADKLKDILTIVETLLSNREELRSIQQRAKMFSHPDSSLKIADLILKNLK